MRTGHTCKGTPAGIFLIYSDSLVILPAGQDAFHSPHLHMPCQNRIGFGGFRLSPTLGFPRKDGTVQRRQKMTCQGDSSAKRACRRGVMRGALVNV